MKKLNEEIAPNGTKPVLVENKFKKLQSFDWSLFIAQSYFDNDRVKLFLILPTYDFSIN